MRFKFAPNLRFALTAIQNDEVFEEPRLVIVKGLHLDGAPSPPARGEETMAVRVRPRADVLNEWTLRVLDAADHERDHPSAVQEDEPPNRSRKHQIALAVVEIRIPPHLLRKREVAKQSAHHV